MTEFACQIHRFSPTDVYQHLKTSPNGLSIDEIARRLSQFGPNTLKVNRPWRRLKLAIKHFTNPFSLLLYVSAVLCFVAESMQSGQSMNVLGYALAAVALLNGGFALAQQYRAERAMEELKKFLPHRVIVRRVGVEQDILAEELVPGDLVLLQEGDKIAADLRVVQGTDLLVNNAPLTGESRLLPLTAHEVTCDFRESPNLAFAGCTILRGTGEAIVFATGPDTEFGRIAALSHETHRPPSPLEREIKRMTRILTLLATSMGLTFFCFGIATGRSLITNLIFMMGIIVANVPEGLLPTLTLALSVGSLRMAKKKVLVKNLEAVESLGAVHVICTDKTGTLTMNEIAVAMIADALQGKEISDLAQRRETLRLAVIASEVHGRSESLRGDPLDIAIWQMYERSFGLTAHMERRACRHFPFDTQKRRESGLFVSGGEIVFAVKGAWESLRPFITSFVDGRDGTILAANPDRLQHAERAVQTLAAQGHRVIAVAYRRLESEPAANVQTECLESDLTLQGFLALDDPIRPEVATAVRSCQRAGIQVVMVTGDHPQTAVAVAKSTGILPRYDGESPPVLLGSELNELTEPELIQRIQAGAAIFARTMPDQKLKIVLAFRQLGQIVAMTGDGVNDAPALKAAHVGIAMGLGGTDVAREASDVVLLDDNFASIVAGVEEGRTIFHNIQKFTDYVLASNVPEIVPYLLFIVLPVPLALTIIQILSVDLGTDILPAIGLGQEAPDHDTMQHPPRSPDRGLLTWRLLAHSYLFFGVLEAVCSLVLFFYVLHVGGWAFGTALEATDPLYRSATGITLSSIVLMQIGNLIGRRSRYHSGLDWSLFRNSLILVGISVEVAFSWAILYWPPIQKILGTGPVPLYVYGFAWLCVPLVFGIDYCLKRTLSSGNRRSVISQLSA